MDNESAAESRDVTGRGIEASSPLSIPLSRRQAIQLASNAVLATAAVGALSASSEPAGARLRLADGSSQLLVRDGTPDWWLSPDIWVVPGSDPNASPGSPVAGDVTYVWARVANVGRVAVADVAVRFYWANPAFEMTYSGINLIGTAYANVPANGTQEVLCLVPWQVTSVNDGHECLVVTASLPGDPAFPDAVDVLGYPQVAQRNLTVVGKASLRLAITLIAPPDRGRSVRISTRIGGTLTPEVLRQYGLAGARAVEPPVVAVGYSRRPGTGPADIGEPVLEVQVPAGGTVPLYTALRRTGQLAPGQYQLVTVLEHQADQLLGGVSFIVTGQE